MAGAQALDWRGSSPGILVCAHYSLGLVIGGAHLLFLIREALPCMLLRCEQTFLMLTSFSQVLDHEGMLLRSGRAGS